MMHVDAFASVTFERVSNRAIQVGRYANININSKTNINTCTKLCTVVASSSNNNNDDVLSADDFSVGLYKKFADHAVERLLETEWVVEDESVPADLTKKEAPTRTNESIVRITTKALIPNNNNNKKKKKKSNPLIRYARITLLETVPISTSASTTTDDNTDGGAVVTPDGIQVLNFVVLPNADTNLPVLGIDLVSLPGSKHLLLLDAQPMISPNPHESHWEDWYKTHVVDENKNKEAEAEEEEEDEPLKFAWGGNFPETVKIYVSKYALWTRLQNINPPVEKDTDDETTTATTTTTTSSNDHDTTPSITAIDVIQGDIFVAFQEHLDTYLELLERYTTDDDKDIKGENNQPSYLDYRRNNDPAKPMLNALYGKEWTQSLLDNVLFPQD